MATREFGSFISRCLSRRTVLRGAGVTMALPYLTAMQPAIASSPTSTSPRRFVAVTLGLGLVQENLVPSAAGRSYQSSRYLRGLEDLRDQITVVSGSSHPGVNGGHTAEASILTGTAMGTGGRAVNTISIDQYLAKHLGESTRFPSLVLAASGTNSPCYTDSGTMISPMTSPRTVFNELFVDDSPQERLSQAMRVRQGRSIMDIVAEDAKSLQRTLGGGDRERLDAYFSSVRQLEKRMEISQNWAKLSKPKVDAKPPVDITDPNDLVARIKTMMDVMELALATDSTRFVTLHVSGANNVLPLEGVEEGYHSLSHHGRDESKLQQLAIVEEAIVGQWGEFLRRLQQLDENESSVLEQTAVLLTSNLGNASNHDNRNMPVLIGGGGFQHGSHLSFDQKNNYPLTNFFVSVAQRCGMEIGEFSTGTSTMSGL